MFRDDLLSARRILVTGGGTGLGKGMARRFLDLGATVWICGRRGDVLDATVQELAGEHAGQIHAIACDVRDPAAVQSMIDQIWQDGPLNAVVNNAAGNFLARTEDLSPRAFESQRIERGMRTDVLKSPRLQRRSQRATVPTRRLQKIQSPNAVRIAVKAADRCGIPVRSWLRVLD